MWQGAEIDLRKLVDDELSPSAIVEVLSRCEEFAGAWRTLALALLEDRELRRVASGWRDSIPCIPGIDFPTTTAVAANAPRAKSSPSPSPSSAASVTAKAMKNVTATKAVSTPAATVVSEKSVPSSSVVFQRAAWWSAAAVLAVLLAVGGYATGRLIRAENDSWNQLADIQPGDKKVPSSEAERGHIESGLPPQLAHESTNPPRRPETPSNEPAPNAVNPFASEPIFVGTSHPVSRVSAKTQLELLNQGVWVEELPVLEQVEVEGQRYAVPNSSIGVQYVGGIAYQ